MDGLALVRSPGFLVGNPPISEGSYEEITREKCPAAALQVRSTHNCISVGKQASTY